MTNHGETTGSTGNGDIGGSSLGNRDNTACDAHPSEHQITLRTPAELADALPYLLGYRPEDSIVLVALRDRSGRGRFGGRARLGIPGNREDWASVARQLAHGLITGSERRGAKPEQMVAYLCQEPARGESGRQVKERLAALAGMLRIECGQLDVPVIEALCISDGRFWSYCCPSEECCPPDGVPMGLPGTSVLAAAATYAGIQVRGTLRELRARLLPWETAAALEQEVALDTASMELVPRMLDEAGRTQVALETVELAERVMARLSEAPHASGTLQSDLRDDELLGHEEAAALILGLQDRTTRDRAAEWIEEDEAGPALRLWRALARRCVGPYGEHAAAPLTLAGWAAWSTGDDIEAREALAMALGADPGYVFARLLHQACNEGLDPESIRGCLRAERARRARAAAADTGEGPDVDAPAVDTGEGPDADAPAQRDGTPGAGDTGPSPSPTAASPSIELSSSVAVPVSTGASSPVAVPSPAAASASSTAAPSATVTSPSIEAPSSVAVPVSTGASSPVAVPSPVAAPLSQVTAPPVEAPSSAVASRRRRRSRPRPFPDSRPGASAAGGRRQGADGSRPRGRSAGSTRPGARRTAGAGSRTAGEDTQGGRDACPGSVRPGNGDEERP